MNIFPRFVIAATCIASAMTASSSTAFAAIPTYTSPDTAVLTSISGIDGTSLDDTVSATGWINTYYSPNDRVLYNYVDAGSSVTLTWLVSGPTGLPLANTAVTLGDNLAYSNSSGTTWNVAGLNNNPNTDTSPNSYQGGTMAGTTNASGVVSFVITNTNHLTGARPSDLTSISAAAANRGPYPWSRFYLVVGNDDITDVTISKVNQATDLVDLLIIPPATAAGITPAFTTPVPTTSGFTTQISNYSSTSTWHATVAPTGSASIGTTGLVTVTGVAAGASSTLTVTTSRSGYTNGSASVRATATAAGAPSAPQVTTTLATGAITTSWTTPDSGSSALVSYTVTVTNAVGTIVATKVVKTTTASYKVSGLTNGASYNVTVIATNAKGTSSVAGVANNIVPQATVKLNVKKPTVIYGNPVTFNATVGTADSGTVTFATNGSTLCSATVASGAASCTRTTPLMNAGTYSVSATYSGNGATRPASATSTLLIKQASAVLTLAPSTATFTPSQLSTITVATGITSATSGSPTGALNLTLDGQDLCISAGTCNVWKSGFTSIGVGHHTLLLTYPGNTNFIAAAKRFTIVVTKDSPTSTTTTTTTVPPTTTTTVHSTTTTTVVGTSLTPTFSAVTATIGGFRFSLTNYNAANTYGTTAATGLASVAANGLVTVTGLAPGASSDVTINVSRSGYASASGHVSGAAISNSPSVANPDRAVLTAVSGTYGTQIDDTANGLTHFINAYYNNADHWYMDYLVGGSTATLTWHVTGANGQVLANQPVTLFDNLAYSSATGTTWAASGLNTNPNGTMSGTTDANGNVTFTVTNTNSAAGTPPTDVTSIGGAEGNEGLFPWSCFLLAVGNDVYTGDPAQNVNQSTDRVDFIVIPGNGGPAPQSTLTIANAHPTSTVSTAVTLTTSGGSGTGSVTFSATGTGCSLNQSTLTASTPTSCVVTATKAASTGFLSATSASVTFTFVSASTPTFANPDVATLTTITGIQGSIIDDTANAQSWFLNAYFEGSDTFGYAYVNAGTTVTMTWHVTGPTGSVLANKAVTLIDNLASSNSSGTQWSVSSLNNNPSGTLSGTTDANGNVTFTLVNTNANTGSRPSDITSNTAAHTNENTAPWTRVILQVGTDVPTANPNTTVNQSTTEVDLIVIPTVSTVINYDTTPGGPLLWSETFTGTAGTGLNAAIWTPEIGQYVGVAAGLPDWPYGTGEIENNTANPANVSLDGSGNLAITATCTTSCASGGNWTSARISTAGKANFQYGQLEARIKVPAGPFNWPAFWMLGQNFFTGTNWPNSGEIDIMEGLGNNSVNQSTLHANYPGGGDWNGGGGVTMYASSISDLSSGYHTFGMLWTPNEIQFTLDGLVYGSDTYNASAGTVTQQIGTSTSTFTIGGQVWPFNQPFFIILQDAIPGGTSAPNGSSGTMSVDWIKYYSYQGYGAVTP